MFGQAFLQAVSKSNETIRFDISAKRLELQREQQVMMKVRQMLWMILEYFKTNQSLNQKYAFNDLQT
eukprot:10131710-Lingulodinium_polyedra.AAC.1